MVVMKDSGIEWVGQIPNGWQVLPIYTMFNERKHINWHGTERNLLSLSYGKIVQRDYNAVGGLLPANFNGYNIIEPNDIVFRLTDMQNDHTSLRTALSMQHGIITSAYVVIKPKTVLDSRFVQYMVYAYDIEKVFYNMGGGVRQGLNFDGLSKLKIPIPAMPEQVKISDFLDLKCSEIAALHADIEKEIEILEEYKKSVITEAVTKGLDKNVAMKDSGVEWIGEIPENWNVEKIKYHLMRNEPRNPGNTIVLSVYREYGVIPKDSRNDNHNVTSADTSNYKFVRKGNLVINKMKAWQGSLAVSNYEGIVSPAYFIYQFVDNIFNKKYFHYLIRTCYKDEFRRISGGIREGQWDLSADVFVNEFVLIPPINEQNAIVQYLEQCIAETDTIIAEKQNQITILDEYKKSVIFEYVTGKKEVPSDYEPGLI